MVRRLYRRYRNMWCRICSYCIGTTQSSAKLGGFCTLAGLKCGDGVESFDVDRMLAQLCGPTGVGVRKSMIGHERAGTGWFAMV